MGGNALKEVNTKRLNREEFELVKNDVINTLQKFFPEARIEAIPAYSSKSSFGDLDILISEHVVEEYKAKEKENKYMSEINPLGLLMERLFNGKQSIENDTVLSFDYRFNPKDEYGFQVDLIYTQDKYFDFAKNYFSYNDLGNLIGRVAAAMGLKFGHQGLVYSVKHESNNFALVEVSNDFYKSLDFLGFSVEEHKKGFYDLNEIFKYVSTSKYFNPDIYKLENRSYKERVRDRKRPTYRAFLEYSKKLEDTENSFYQFPDKKEWLPTLFNTFPGFQSNWNKAWKYYDNKNKAKILFNGTTVGSLVNLEHKYLGHFMNHVRSKFTSPQEFYSWIVEQKKEDLKSFILKCLVEFDTFKQDINIEEPTKNLLKFKKIKM